MNSKTNSCRGNYMRKYGIYSGMFIYNYVFSLTDSYSFTIIHIIYFSKVMNLFQNIFSILDIFENSVRDIFRPLLFLKVFFSGSFTQISQKNPFQITILNLKFEISAHNIKNLFKFQAQDIDLE